MKVTVVGSGHGGCAVAAVLAMKGHEVNILKIGSTLHNKNFKELKEKGSIRLRGIEGEGTMPLHKVTRNAADVIPESDLILVYYVANFHPLVAKAIAPFLNKKHLVALGPGYMGSLIFEKEMAKLSNQSMPLFAEFETLPYSSRITEPGVVDIVSKNVRHPFASYPATRKNEIKESLDPVIGECFPRNNLIEVSLHNPNLVIHTIGVLMNAALIEDTDKKFAMYRDGFSPSIWKLVQKLDNEKMDVLEKIGVPRIPYFDAFRFRTFINTDIDPLEGFKHYASEAPDGPFTVNNRYVTEDVPMGLGLLLSLGARLNIETPICESLMNIANAFLPEHDFFKEARSLESFWDGTLTELLEKITA